MTYLLAKYALIFVLATIAGYILGRWMTGRKFVDVTESYEDLRMASSNSDAPQWDKLWSRLDSIPVPVENKLAGVNERLDSLAYAITNLPVPPTVDLASVEGRLEAVSDVIGGLSTHADVSSLSAMLGEVDAVVRRVPQESVDLNPIDERLRAIESALQELRKRPVDVPRSLESLTRVTSTESTVLKKTPPDKKDNLRLISGIGPKLERLLNKNGVSYFWQIASWTDSDIDSIDARLDTFKGRIGRDEWISQADRLRREPGSARQPTEMWVGRGVDQRESVGSRNPID